MSSATRWLVNASSVVALLWIAFVIYAFFTDHTSWSTVYAVLERPAGTFCALVLAGLVPIGAVTWAIWRIALRGRPEADTAHARVHRI